MIRQNIILDNFTYIVDLYKANSDLINNQHSEKFVILKTNNLINNVMHDKDVLFIKKSIFEKCMNEDSSINVELLGQMIAFPITNDLITISYSSNYQAFNGSYMKETFVLDKDIYKIYDKQLRKESNILCDKLRIWFPINKSKLNGIIHVSNIINDIRFHYICENIDNYERDSNSEIKVGNNLYSEYIDIWIPNVECLFQKNYLHYIKENYNLTKLKEKITYNYSKNDYITIYPCVYYENDDEHTNVEKILSIEAFRTYGLDSSYKIEVSINGYNHELDWDLMSCNANFRINDSYSCNIIIKNGNRTMNIYSFDAYNIRYKNSIIYTSLSLMALPFFIGDQSTVLTEYPEKVYFENEADIYENIMANPLIITLFPFSSINETTKTYETDNTIENSDVFVLNRDLKLSINFDFNADLINDGIDNYGIYMLNCNFKYHSLSNLTLQDFYLNKVKLSKFDYRYNDIVDHGEYDDEIFDPKIEKCGFIIEMSTDSSFKSLIYSYVINMDIENDKIIDDIKLKLNLDEKQIMWNAYPDTLLIRVKFIDKVSYTIITSNTLFITKENFKYIINNGDQRLALIDNNQDLYNQVSSTQYNNTNLNSMAFNFIDKINCTIVSKESNTENEVTNSKTNQRIIYKPIFYKVKDLQQIKLKNGITQNIGLNLSDILSKVNTFKIVINGIEFPEVARNDAFVIFKINSQNLSGMSGQYNLIDQDDQFISDGTWYIY